MILFEFQEALIYNERAAKNSSKKHSAEGDMHKLHKLTEF